MAHYVSSSLAALGLAASLLPHMAAASVSSPPVSMPNWWGSMAPQTASFFVDFTDGSSLDWDESLVGEGLVANDFSISVTNMHWVDDAVLGRGFQAHNADGAMVFTYDNLMVLTNKKSLIDVLEISTDDISRIKDPVVEAIWGGTDWDQGGAVGGIQTSWEWEHKQGNTWLLKINSVLTPQPDKVRITLPVVGGSGPVIHRGWTGEHCSTVPEVQTWALAGAGMFTVGLSGMARTRRRRLL